MDTGNIIVASEVGVSIASFDDVGNLIGTCFGASGILLTESELAPQFFDLKTGLAGDLLQKVTNYRLRTAILIKDARAYGPRFAELVLEHQSSRVVRFFHDRLDADTWLRE